MYGQEDNKSIILEQKVIPFHESDLIYPFSFLGSEISRKIVIS